MKTKEILNELIEYLDLYENEADTTGSTVNLSDFLGYLNSKHTPQNIKTSAISGNYSGYKYDEQSGSATDISILIVLLFRYAKAYMRKALKNSPIKSADEFSFLMTLMTYDSLSKSELIQKQVMEKTSGSEIINRLIKLGLIEQANNESDKRSINVKMTEYGRIEIYKILPQMQSVSQIVTGNLDESEKTTLAYMLRKLDHFHNDIFMNKKDVDISELIINSM